MKKKEIIRKTIIFSRKKLLNDPTGHDWWHTYRVWQISKKLAKEEKADTFIVEMAALLHDVWDWKFHKEETTRRNLDLYLKKHGLTENDRDQITSIIFNMSFKGSKFKNQLPTKEGQIVYDADKLDAIGAIGISRGMITGTSLGQPMYNPDIPLSKISIDLTKKASFSCLHHFNDKLFLIKSLLHTKTARKIAIKRHIFMKKFYHQFLKEWEGEL